MAEPLDAVHLTSLEDNIMAMADHTRAMLKSTSMLRRRVAENTLILRRILALLPPLPNKNSPDATKVIKQDDESDLLDQMSKQTDSKADDALAGDFGLVQGETVDFQSEQPNAKRYYTFSESVNVSIALVVQPKESSVDDIASQEPLPNALRSGSLVSDTDNFGASGHFHNQSGLESFDFLSEHGFDPGGKQSGHLAAVQVFEKMPTRIDFVPPEISTLMDAEPVRADNDLIPKSNQSSVFRWISGLLTNRDNLLEDENIAAPVRAGVRAIAGVEDLEAAANALCLVLTNAVEVQDKDGRSLGVAVYDTNFSWINHNCSPNACYRFLFSPPPHHRDNTPSPCQSRMRLRPVLSSGEIGEYDNAQLPKAVAGRYGPRIFVRSIKRINRGDKVTVAYTDLLQPKAVRQSELWEKYRFLCCCVRCNSSPPSYVDLTLQELCTSNFSDSSLSSDSTFCRDKAVVNIRDYVDEVISEYLSVGDAKICCEKLERVLIFGLIDEHLKFREGNLQFNLRLHHLPHLALNAYITLASAYKMQSCDSLVLYSELDGHQFDNFHTSRINAAYSFFLAAATNHLFHYEASLIASAANFWINAGESLVTLARSSDWSFFEERNLPVLNILYLGKHKCCKCSFLDRYQTTLSFNFVDFERTSREFLDCITSLSHKVWNLLSGGCYYLKLFKDPFDLGRHEIFGSFSDSDFQMKEIVRIATDFAEAIQFVHDHDVAYQDLNTQRILLARHGIACLGDMGIVTACKILGEAVEYATDGYRWLAPATDGYPFDPGGHFATTEISSRVVMDVGSVTSAIRSTFYLNATLEADQFYSQRALSSSLFSSSTLRTRLS